MRKRNFTILMLALLAANVMVVRGADPETESFYPTKDTQFRYNNTATNGTQASYEVRHGQVLEGVGQNQFVAGLAFDLSSFVDEDYSYEITKAELRFTTSARETNSISVKPFSTDWGEAGGTTDSYAAKVEYINAAIAEADLITAFSPVTGANNKKPFEWIPGESMVGKSIKDWQTTTTSTEFTAYIQECIDNELLNIGLLLVPATNGTDKGPVLFSKDANSETNYGTSTTKGYNPDGSETGSNVTRWSRIVDLLALDGSGYDQLYPMMTLTYTVTPKNPTSINSDTVESNPEFVNVYNIDGREVRTNVKFEDATKDLSKGLYIINKKKVIVTE